MRKWKFFVNYCTWRPVSGKALFKKLVGLFKNGKKIDKGIWITDNWTYAYFHWFADALPRLLACEEMIDGHQVILPDYYKNIPFISESLQFLGYSPFYYEPAKRLTIQQLLLPSHTAPIENYNSVVINNLRNRFLKNNGAKPQRKIYISRARAQMRKIINEKEVIALLRSFDVEIHYFEDYTLSKQVAIMAETKILIGLHGAGLANMLFMKEQGRILELKNSNDGRCHCYFSLASALSHHYYYQLNQGDYAKEYPAWVRRKIHRDSDVTVNLEKLKQNLISILEY